jgi:hypothetical protein
VTRPAEVTTESLLTRWRQAETSLRKTKPGTITWMMADQLARETRHAYQQRVDEVAAAERGDDAPTQ